MIADHTASVSADTVDRRRLPRATQAEIKANREARKQKYREKTIPAWGFHRRPWAQHENDLVLHPNGYSDHVLSKMLQRSVTCIQVRRSKLKASKK